MIELDNSETGETNMKLLIQADFVLEDLCEEDYKVLKAFTVFNRKDETDPTKTTVISQKVTLEHEDMETLLDIFDEGYHHGAITLHRFENSRYELVLKPFNRENKP